MNTLTTDQKIELMKLAAQLEARNGCLYMDASLTVENYEKLVAAIEKEPTPTS
ncbi:hypothetical protein ABDK00_014265 [Niabella insulamsoli]|uniref:hypothetical protein n=1 Tax=Niabella insulamsoli TaxID=3144874 RepID=UPI0031FBFC0A